MESLEKLHLLIKLLREFNLPVSPILEYAIQEKESELTKDVDKQSSNYQFIDNIETHTTQSHELHHNMEYSGIVNGSNGLVFRKLVDKSVLMQGFVIGKKFHDDFFAAMGYRMEYSTNRYLYFLTENRKYEVKISYNKNATGYIQLTIYYGDDLKSYFQRQFRSSYNSLMKKRESMEIRHGVFARVDKGREEYLELYRTSNPQVFKIVCVTLDC